MALVVKDRVKETSTTAGTGTLTLAGASTGFQSFAAIGNANTTYYTIVDNIANTWEVGIGTYTSSGTTLSRDTVLANSSGNTSPISFAANSKDVFCTYPAGRSVYSNGTNIVPSDSSIVAVADGGTGLTSGTSGGVLYYSATGTLASSAALAASALVLGGGAGAAPATTTTGTGVVTAVGTAINTGGGFVTQSGVLAASALLLGGGSATAISSTTTGTGVVTALGNTANAAGGFTTIDGTATLTNKRINPRTSTAASTATLTPDIASFDQYNLTAQAASLAVNAPTGTPVDGNKLIIRILDNGTTRAITWDATYTVIGTTLPTATTVNKMLYVGCIYNSTNTRWDVIAVTTQA